jgi:hypothetical protein
VLSSLAMRSTSWAGKDPSVGAILARSIACEAREGGEASVSERRFAEREVAAQGLTSSGGTRTSRSKSAPP